MYKNCVGTALYLLGMQKRDNAIQPKELEKYLALFEQQTDPSLGALVVVRDPKVGNIRHVGVLSFDKPSQYYVMHRAGTNREETKTSLEEFKEIFDTDKIQYYQRSHIKVRHTIHPLQVTISTRY